MRPTRQEIMEKATQLDQEILSILTEAAENGDPCPSNTEMAGDLSRKSTHMSLKRLERRGLIKRETRPMKVRRIFVASVGKWTGWGKGFRAVPGALYADRMPHIKDERPYARLPAGGFGEDTYLPAVQQGAGKTFRPRFVGTYVPSVSTAAIAVEERAA